MRTIILAVVALGGLAAVSLGTPSTASAQGVYFDAPGVSVGIGRPWYRHHRYYDPYAYGYSGYYARPYWWHRHHYRWHDWEGS
jgi:hypothetical protein